MPQARSGPNGSLFRLTVEFVMASLTDEYGWWDKAAHDYDADHRYIVRDFDDQIRPWLTRQFTEHDTLLEVGCGTGLFSEMIVDQVRHLTATDMSPKMLEHATEKLASHGNARVQREDAYRLSFKDERFDAVLLVNLLHVVNAPIAVAKECNRVLKPGGRIVAVDGTRYGARILPMIGMMIRYMRRRGLPPTGNKSFSPAGVATIMEEAGFAVRQVELIGTELKAVCLSATKPD